MNSNLEDIMDQIVKKKKISKEEIQRRIVDIKKEFDGLLTDEGALAIIAKEQGIEIEEDPTFYKRRLYINELDIGMQAVSVAGRVVNIFPIREFKKKSGDMGKVVSLSLSDKTSNIKATLWNDHVKFIDDGSIKSGKIIELKSCYVKEGWKGQKEINLGNKGEIELNPDVDLKDFPDNMIKNVKIGEIKPDMDDVSIEGKIINISEIKDITTKDGRQTKLQELIIGDESGQIRVPVWGNKIESVEKAAKGDTIRIENGYTKEGFGNQINLNIGNSSIIEINPEGVEVPPFKEIKLTDKKITSFSNDKVQIKIDQLVPGSKNVNLIGKCIEIGEIRQVANNNKVMEIVLGDETGIINCSVWNDDIEGIRKGESYRITNGYITSFKNKIKLNTGKFGKIEISENKITKVNMKKNLSEEEFKSIRKKIIEISENQSIEVRGTITDLNLKNIIYNSCPTCMKKVSTDNGGIFCPTCGEISDFVVRMLFSFTLDDGTNNIRVTVMGDLAEKFLNLNSEDVQNLDVEKLNEFTSNLLAKEQFLGKEIIIIGRTKRNKFNEQLEIIAQKIDEPIVLNEIKNLIEDFK